LFGKVVAFAGIGYPKKFFDSVAAMPKVRVMETASFPDHHFYSKDDILRLFRMARKHGAELVCTEKDWVKLPENIRRKIKYAPLAVQIQPEFWEWVGAAAGKSAKKKESRKA
jgi:tetraacyldisaccharide 4'-kinase